MMKIIYDIDNITNTYDGDMAGRRWIMTPKGLACVDCDGLTKPKKKSSNVDVDIDMDGDDVNIRIKTKDKQEKLEIRQQRLEEEMKERERELQKIQKELEQEIEGMEETEEASFNPEEIILKRVVNATYWITPSIQRTVSQSIDYQNVL